MNPDIEAIKDTWDKESGGGRDADQTRALSDQYVDANPDQFAKLAELDQDGCVHALEVFRDAGFVEEAWRVQVWLFHRYEPQNIGGKYEPQLRIPGKG